MYIFLAIIRQMGLVKDTPFYTNTMKCDRCFHILRFLYFSDNMNQPDKNGSNCDRLENENAT